MNMNSIFNIDNVNDGHVYVPQVSDVILIRCSLLIRRGYVEMNAAIALSGDSVSVILLSRVDDWSPAQAPAP